MFGKKLLNTTFKQVFIGNFGIDNNFTPHSDLKKNKGTAISTRGNNLKQVRFTWQTQSHVCFFSTSLLPL